MRYRPVILFILTVFLLLEGNIYSQQVSSPQWSSHKAGRWYKKKEWLHGWPVKPSRTIDKIQFASQYQLNQPDWDKAFAFLKEHDLQQLSKGKYPIDGDHVYASITEDSSKDFEKTNWESHRKYIDIQYVIRGKELIGVYPVSKATVIKPYDEKRDAANYSANGKLYAATPETFFIFFPSDAHRPNITPGGNKPVKKIVIKVRVVGAPNT